jgi:diguanylate cyclase (GGDEF)-like protein
MRALVADDERTTTAILAKTLQRWHVEPVVAHDGHAAWQMLTSGNPPLLAIVDWMMPGVDGPELCRRIRNHSALAHLYVILLTGRNSHEDLVAGLDAGADDYIIKPFHTEELRARVHVGIRVATLQERLADQVAELQRARNDLARLASTDGLTGVNSRRRWFELAAAELWRCRRYYRPLSFMMIDLDFFKNVNDTFGHTMGDEVLKRFADVLRTSCRESDVIGRLGGEEFAIMLPETGIHAAKDAAVRITECCRAIAIPTLLDAVRFSCSIGVAEAISSDDSVERVIRRADGALYEAKRNGRDRVELFDESQLSLVSFITACTGAR